MRILIAHNAYQQRGGEDSVVDAEMSMMKNNGHEVRVFARSNDDIVNMGKLSAVKNTFWSSRSFREVEQLFLDFKPDVLHVHNTFPLISPSLYWAAARYRIPVVQTLHNFRLLCPQAMFLYEGKVCERCLNKFPLPGIARGCYRQSRAQTMVLSGMLSTHRFLGTYKNKITRYIALNDFCRRKFIAGGIPAEKIVIKPNFVDVPLPTEADRDGFLFVGRLSEEKGIDVLLGAYRQPIHGKLSVAGSGPEADKLKLCPEIEALGFQQPHQVRALMARVEALILPSIWYEQFPVTLVEALASGLPVIASRLGALAELVDDGVTGLLFDPGNSLDLAEKMAWAKKNPEKMLEMGRNARMKYEMLYTPAKNYEQLMNIYEEAIQACR